MSDPSTPTPTRTWWTPEEDRGWSLVRAALRREWEQTKADFTGGRKGADLEQNVGDTLGQAFGKQRLPPEGQPNPMTPEEQAAHVRRAAERMERTGKELAEDTEESVGRRPAVTRHDPTAGTR